MTFLSFLCGIGAGISYLLPIGLGMQLLSAAVFLILCMMLDAADGYMSRLYNECSSFGAFLDSVMDRLSEVAIYWAIAWSGIVNWSIVFAALSGSLIVSYTRARGEGLDLKMKRHGIAERPVRFVILIGATIMNQLQVGLVLIAALTGVTIVQRVESVRHATYEKSMPQKLTESG